MATDTARLFLALWPTPGVRATLAAAGDACAWPAGAARVPPERLHVTLHFIGAVPRDRVAAIAAGLEPRSAAFELRIERIELWPHGLAVLQPQTTPPALADLHGRLGASLRALGLATETRPYRPHVTLARRAVGATLAPMPRPVRWRVRSHVLVESRPGAGGGYAVLQRYP